MSCLPVEFKGGKRIAVSFTEILKSGKRIRVSFTTLNYLSIKFFKKAKYKSELPISPQISIYKGLNNSFGEIKNVDYLKLAAETK